MPDKIVLAYSGGLDTSIIIPWLKENYDYDVIAMVADVGQGDDIEAVVQKAYATGASKVVVEDMREEFLTGYVFPALKALWAGPGRRAVRNLIAVAAEGYPFPTNLDRDQPINGLAPQSQAQLLAQAVEEAWDAGRLRAELAAQQERSRA